MQKKLVCDLDGVTVDCLRPALRFHNRHDLADDPSFPPTYSWAEGTGMSDTEFWDRIEEAGPTFWSELPFTTFGLDLLTFLFSTGLPVEIATLAVGPNGAAGKYDWAKRVLPPGTPLHITTNKESLSFPGHLLIDDSPKNVERWEARGGDAILCPAPYNSNKEFIGKELLFIQTEMRSLGYV